MNTLLAEIARAAENVVDSGDPALGGKLYGPARQAGVARLLEMVRNQIEAEQGENQVAAADQPRKGLQRPRIAPGRETLQCGRG
ncbi:MAG: hypothetical protein L0211_07630 [Planctomycetaceae bacterium]|nr:hypothetical protein [Planctomycetaceae bacterium]